MSNTNQILRCDRDPIRKVFREGIRAEVDQSCTPKTQHIVPLSQDTTRNEGVIAIGYRWRDGTADVNSEMLVDVVGCRQSK